MTTLQKTIIGATLAVAVGTGIYEAREASNARADAETLRQQQVEQAQLLNQALAEATNQVAALRNDNERLNRNATELLRLRGEVARLKNDARTATEEQAADTATESTAKSWLERVNFLKQRLEHTPEANIPELQLLTDKDWLLAAANKLDTDTDYRRALSSLRQLAKNKTSPLIKEALKKYAEANGDKFPSEASQLKPYCNPPLNDAILSRYKVIPMDYLNVGLSGKLALAEGSPVDAEYDSRSVFGPKGSMTGTPFRSFPIDKTLWPVLNDFKAANPQLNPSAPSQLLPYATKPEQQAALQQLTEAVEAYKRDHNGQSPNEIPELSPYLKAAK